jgi:hypothetical protein
MFAVILQIVSGDRPTVRRSCRGITKVHRRRYSVFTDGFGYGNPIADSRVLQSGVVTTIHADDYRYVSTFASEMQPLGGRVTYTKVTEVYKELAFWYYIIKLYAPHITKHTLKHDQRRMVSENLLHPLEIKYSFILMMTSVNAVTRNALSL